MGCVCFVVVFLLALDVERIQSKVMQLDNSGELHDRYVMELPLENDTEAENTEGISSRYRRYATSHRGSTSDETPQHVDVVAIPLVPGLPALPPHMNIKPPANFDDTVFTCEAILPQPWQRLPTKSPKVHTKTPPKITTTLPTKPVHTTQPSKTKSTPIPSQNGKVSAFDLDDGTNMSSDKDKKQKNSTIKSPKEEDNNKSKNDNRDDGNKFIDNVETTTSKQKDDNKTKNNSNQDSNSGNSNTKVASSTTAKIPQQQEKNENEYTTPTPPEKNNNGNQSNNNKNIDNGGKEQGSVDITNSVAGPDNPPVGGGGSGLLGNIADTGKGIVGGVAGAGVVGGIIVGGTGLGVLGNGVGTISGGVGGAVGGVGGAIGGVSSSGAGGGGALASGNAASETPSNSLKQPQQNKPNSNSKNNNSDKNTKDKQNNKQEDKGKEDDSDNDFDLDDLLDEDDFIDYTKFEVKLHSIDDIAVIFANKFKRLEYVCEWFTQNFTNELNNLTVFQNKYFDMAAKVQTLRQNLGDMIEEETDNDVYNQKLEAYNVGVLIEEHLESFQKEIDYIHTIVSQFADAASIVENEVYNIKTRFVELILSAADFTHHTYRDVGGVRVLATVAQLRTTDCLSPYISIYRTWRNAMKRLYLEGIQLERDTYNSLSGEHYTDMSEWKKVEGKFTEFTDRSKKELEGARQNVDSLRDPIYECVVDVAQYMFYRAQKVMEAVRTHVVFN